MKKRIDIQGISTTAAYQDGDCSRLTNLRKKNGVLRPVTPRKVVRTLNSAYSYQFIHNLPQGGENLLAVRTIPAHDNTYNYRGAWSGGTTYNANDAVLYNSAYYYLKTGTSIGTPPGYGSWNQITGTTEISGSNLIEHVAAFTGLYKIESNNAETLIMQVTAIKSITQLGNILNIIDSQSIKYIFWVEDQYKIINTDFGGLQTDSVLGPVKVDLKVDGITNEDGYQLLRTYRDESVFSYSSLSQANSNENIKLRCDVASALLQKAINIEHKLGNITGFIQAISAYELFDGSYIFSSNPILLNQAFDKNTRYQNLSVDSSILDYINNKGVFYGSYGSWLPTNIEYNYSEHGYETEKVWKNGGTYANGIETTIMPSQIVSFEKQITTSVQGTKLAATISSNRLKFKINTNISSDYELLIKSISIFISPQVNQYDISETSVVSEIYVGNSGGFDEYYQNIIGKPKTNAEIIKELSDNQQFYKVHEISFDDLQTITPETWIEIDLKNKLGENLVMQEELPVDNFTHHSILPEKQLVYNSKIHVMDYKQELFHGWPILYFDAIQGTGQFQTGTITLNGSKQYWIEVHIKTESGISKTVRERLLLPETKLGTYFNSMISYPDSRAVKMIVYEKIVIGASEAILKTEYKLTASETANFAYYISEDLKPIANTDNGVAVTSFVAPNESNRTLIYRNTMKVSAVNNPFYYPAETTYTIGTGIIRAAGTNALRMSEGQFGQYDLYVLTTEGTYSFDTGTEISYNRKSPASLIIPTSDIICSTPYGIIFIGERGAYILSGQQPELISAQIEETDGETDFISFLENLKDILFDAKQDEIIFVGTTEHWVFNIPTKSWYTSTEAIDYEIKNSYQLMVAAGTAQKQYNLSETNIAAVVIATRPIYFGVDEVKKLQRAILRGRFMYLNTSAFDEEAFLQLHGSRDGIETTMLRGYNIPSNKQDRSYKDFDLGMMARANYRSYILKLQGSMDEKSQIEYIDFEIADPLNNDKMR